MGALARATAPLAAGALWDRAPAAPYLAGALCAVVAAALVAGGGFVDAGTVAPGAGDGS
jgi:hypothetical protein